MPGDEGLVESAIRRHEVPAETDVTVIDDSDLVGWLASFTRSGEVYMTDTVTMVKNVRTALSGSQKISRLNILDHGNPDGVQFGSDWITKDNVSTVEPLLRSLKPLFAAGAFVHLQHCDAGQNKALMLALARGFGVPVYAGTGAQNPIYRVNFGDYVRADPDGSFHTDVGRP